MKKRTLLWILVGIGGPLAVVFILPMLTTTVPRTTFQTFTVDDLVWDQSTRPYQHLVVKGVNKLHRENRRCRAIDLATVTLSSKKGTNTNPVFSVVCGKRAKAFPAFFSKADVEANKTLAAIPHLDKRQAMAMCERYAKSQATHPSTVHFSKMMSLTVRQLGDGQTQIFSTFTAKNSFNMELTYNIVCLVNTKGMISGRITEAR